MRKKGGSYHLVELAPGRRWMMHFNRMYWQNHCMYGLLEVDVTLARQFIARQKALTGETLSFTGYMTCCLAQAVAENRRVQSYIRDQKHLLVYDQVDVGLMVERKVGEKHTLMGYVVRGAERKTFREIHMEIREAQRQPVPPGRGMPGWLFAAISLPWPLSNLADVLLGLVRRNDPDSFAALSGTVGITAVGMFGKGMGGWGVVPLPYTLGLIVGSIARKPVVVGEHIEPREILNLTVVFDHDVIDGAPAARFTNRLVELIESGVGLDEEAAAIAIEPAAFLAAPTAG